MKSSRLLIDAGNTRLKWAVVAKERWLSRGQAAYADLAQLTGVLASGMRAYVASVTRDENNRRLGEILSGAGVDAHWIASAERFEDVENGYAVPSKLGVDRWMALIAARRRTQSATLVVSAGTAMTVDALNETGRFIGGIIVPGMARMRMALREGTAHAAAENGVWRDFPGCTADAVESGLVAALAGAVEAQYARLAALGTAAPRCLITGGDAEWLLPHLTVVAERVPGLVLEGIDCVARKDEAA